MRIALAHDHLISDGGAERVLQAMSEIWPEAPIYTLIWEPDKAPGFFKRKKIITSYLQKFPLSTKKYQWYLPFRVLAIESFDFSGYDVVLSNSSALMKGVITPPRTLHINYCHTPIRFLWLDKQRLDPLEKVWPISWLSDQYKKKLRVWDLKSVECIDFFVANSINVERRGKK